MPNRLTLGYCAFWEKRFIFDYKPSNGLNVAELVPSGIMAVAVTSRHKKLTLFQILLRRRGRCDVAVFLEGLSHPIPYSSSTFQTHADARLLAQPSGNLAGHNDPRPLPARHLSLRAGPVL
jgi:hypothetical protein